ncbi:hypothetical protein [Raineyella fluvialis]|uniref:Sap, sulfolipid-1-addressing protein n=1 Tax=Raineyella fluvialis TaxID=2662261 RepID=A0A5Q2F858_9ACTN|nr:hypothetical protein [Raineyella fluvialis]QGF23082.1 hypothetical protein Rai3103_04715 [Raineyella fluvialis]
MTSIGGLLLWLLPLTVLAMISPVMFLNSSTVVAHRGRSDRWRFVAGNALVLVVLGALGMGLLGAALEEAAISELDSRRVELVLGVLLLIVSLVLLRGLLQDRARQRAGGPTPVVAEPHLPRSLVGWGAVSMATNLTTVPLYLAMAQRIGASPLPVAVRIGVLVAVTGLVLLPAWGPVVAADQVPARRRLQERTLRRVTWWMRVGSLVASLAGTVLLLWRGLAG